MLYGVHRKNMKHVTNGMISWTPSRMRNNHLQNREAEICKQDGCGGKLQRSETMIEILLRRRGIRSGKDGENITRE